jgi:UbiD family decarboxylase
VVRMVARAGGAGGYQHWAKHDKRKTPMPIAIVVGAAPVVVFTGAQKLEEDFDELGVAGGLAGKPIPIVKCVTIDLDVPADAEIVIEGLIDPEKLEPEAPFGESNGYVALEAYNMPMQVTAITHRRKPVFASIISQVTPSESSLVKKVAYEPVYLSHLRDVLSIRGVRRVVMHEPLTNLRPVIFVQYAAGTPRSEVWRGMHGAASLNAIAGKIIIAVSDDIDPDNLDAVMWAIAYRCNPIEDVHIPPYHGGVQGAQYGNRGLGSKLLIDATLKGPMPPLALPKKEFMERAQELWTTLGLPPIVLKQPWHGYPLGDWIERWDVWADRAVRGAWEETGRETLARQRTGLKPETPARKVED